MTRRVLALPPLLLLLGAPAADAADAPTFSKDVAPILWNHCAGCHRPGEVGPFPLLNYKDASKRAGFLKEVTASKQMPPWKAEPDYGSFHDARTLDDAQVKAIADWADAGAPEGHPSDLPPMPKFPEGWQLGTPDLVLSMAEAFPVPADGKDVFRCFVVPVELSSDRTVSAVEFRPGNRRVVHHAILYLDSTGAARKKDQSDPGPGYASFGGPGFLPTGGLGGWAPGAFPRKLPDGTGKMLRAGSDLVMAIHYHPDGKAETDTSTVGVYFTKSPVKKIVGGIALRSRDIDIPAGESHYRAFAASDPLPAAVEAIGITPHMHNLGREMKVFAETPDGSTIPLIWIKDWAFNWQGQYQYKAPVRLPAGAVLKVEASYDNSESNPRNPSTPPKRVRWGEQTTDEMCLCFIQVVADTPADLRKVLAMQFNRRAAALAGGISGVGRRAAKEATKPGSGPSLPVAGPYNEQLAAFDVDKDGMLSPSEVDAMPPSAASRVRQALKSMATQGFTIPDQHKDALTEYDTNGDGRLSPAEVDAMPPQFRDRVKAAVQSRMGGAARR